MTILMSHWLLAKCPSAITALGSAYDHKQIISIHIFNILDE